MTSETPEIPRDEQETRDRRGRFKPGQSGNPSGRTKRPPIYRKLLEELTVDATAALRDLIAERDPQAVLWVMGRWIPPIKPRAFPVSVNLPDDDPVGQVRVVLADLANGRVTIDEAVALLTAAKVAAEISSVAEMRAELDELKEKLG